ncbi:beta-lactamase/transpeptidase-like protein [Neurospora tetraspora]|uniref:Beta-lactamase/transpeptidase-like protein n=1 Tax=Neurospora tetraspora TaxID=94610 RepID=A0AAE0MSP6_9PEZI|nr:beta-lactamase/transpeptidase-like protein [Neurospora tetraspora]
MTSAKSTLDQILHRYTTHPDSPSTKDKLLGAAFVVVDKSGPIYSGAAGHTSLPITSSSPAFSTDSFLWVASLTKLLTTICLMQLVQQGKLSLDEDIREKLPELTKAGILRGFDDDSKSGEGEGKGEGKAILEEITKPITPRQLLTHSVGLSYDLGHPLLERWAKEVGKKGDTNSMTVEGWTTPLLFAPGEGWVYGTALDWAGVLLERVLGGASGGENTTTLGQYMRKNVFEPLGMETSTLKPAAEPLEKLEKRMKDKLVPVALRDAETGELSQGELPISTAWDPKAESGGAGLWTTAEDYGKALAAVLRAADADEGEGALGLKKETLDQMFSPQLNEKGLEMIKEMGRAFHAGVMPEFPEGFEAVDHGLGGLLNLEDVEGKRRKGSMMWHGYCNSHWWIDRETGIGACLLAEQFPFADPVVIQLYNDLERAVYGELVPEWKAKAA